MILLWEINFLVGVFRGLLEEENFWEKLFGMLEVFGEIIW